MSQNDCQESNIRKIEDVLFQKEGAGLELLRLMQIYLLKDQNQDDLLKIAESNIPTHKVNETGYSSIGTWEPIMEDGEVVFKRTKQDDSVFWESKCEKFNLNKQPNCKRICVIGESVAAGMFFTPYLSPTKTLSDYLEMEVPGIWDVIDLTRNSMNAGALLETCKSALQLKPDYMLIIAGNNWYTDITIEHNAPISRRKMYARSLDVKKISGMIEEYQKQSLKFAKSIIREIDTLSKYVETKFLFVIPAINYKDWERRYPLHWLGNGKTKEWYINLKKAITAIENKDFETSIKLGKLMIKLDGNTNTTSNRIVAKSLLENGNNEMAYQYCASESNSALLFDEITSFPGMTSVVRNEIIKSAEFYKEITFFDMENIFQKNLNEITIGNPYFIDYCHLSPEGFRILMKPIAEYIVGRHIENGIVVSNIDPFYLSTAYFCVALYNSHLNRPITNKYDTSKFKRLFQKAVDCCENVLDIMELYVKAKSCQFGTGFGLSKAGQKLSTILNSPLDMPITQQAPGVDALTISCICEVLNNNNRNGNELLEAYQEPYIRLLDKGVDLVDPAYLEWINLHTAAAIDSENGTWRNNPYHKSWWPWSYFTLVSDNLTDLVMEIVLRVPDNSNNSSMNNISISINDKVIKSISVANTWSTFRILISRKNLIQGFNRVSVEWSDLNQDEDEIINNIKEQYILGRNVDFYPIFGEIYSMKIKRNEY